MFETLTWAQPTEIRPCQSSETKWLEEDKSRRMMSQTDVNVYNCRVSLDFPNMLRLLFTKPDSLKLGQLRYNKIQLQRCQWVSDVISDLWCDAIRYEVRLPPEMDLMRWERGERFLWRFQVAMTRQRRQVDHHDVSPHTGVVLYSAPGWSRYRVCIVLWSGENSARFSVYLQWWQALE